MNRKFLHLILLISSVCFCSAISAEPELRTIDPSDLFYRGWQTVKSAEKLEEEAKYSEALEKYSQASKYFDTLGRFHKDWKPAIVNGRIDSTKKSIEKIRSQAFAEQTNRNNLNKELIESSIATDDKEPRNKSAPSVVRAPVLDNSSEMKRRMQQLEKENNTLKIRLQRSATTKAPAPDLATQARLKQIIAEKNTEITTIRNLLSRAPMQQDADRLKKKNLSLNSDIITLGKAVRDSKAKLDQAQKRSKDNQMKAALAQKSIQKITNEMQQQQGVNNAIITKLREEMKGLNKLLNTTQKDLGDSRREVKNLSTQLNQSQSMVAELTVERDTLRTQYIAISDILKQNDSKGIQNLITENMRLGTELKQTADRLAFLETSNDVTKDDLVEAKSNLAIAKTRIIKYRDEQSDYLLKIRALDDELKTARVELKRAENQPGTALQREETEVLKSTVKRLITTQEVRNRQEKILWENYQKSGTTIPGMAAAFSDLRKTEIALSDEEKVILAGRRPDQEFQNPDRVPMAHAQAHGEALKSEIKGVMPLVSRLFEKERYQAARQILSDLDERFPGNMQILCTRGVIELKTNNYVNANDLFNEAVTMNEENDYAHYMLGVTYYKNQDLDNARNSFERSLTLNPTNEKTHLYLGSIAGRQKRFQQSEEHFITATKLDPTYPDAFYNLAALYLQQKNKFKALQYYEKALQNGKAPDFNLEAAINNLKN